MGFLGGHVWRFTLGGKGGGKSGVSRRFESGVSSHRIAHIVSLDGKIVESYRK